MAELIGLIPAAGKGVRAYPYTEAIPKSMLEVDGVPLVQRNVELMRDQLGIRTIRIVLGHCGAVIQQHLGDGTRFGVGIEYVHNPRLDLELPYSIFLGSHGVDDYCCVILADECYVGSNHDELLRHPYREALVTCGIIAADNPKHIRKNYVATFRDGLIADLHEKPRTVSGSLMGTGTYLLHPDALRRLRAEFEQDLAAGPKDWVTWLGGLCRDGARALPFLLRGGYVNVNSRDDLNYANYLVRDRDFDMRTKSLIYIIDEETEAAVRPIDRFAERDELDEIVAVSRRTFPALSQRASHPKVRVVASGRLDDKTGDLVKLGLDGATGAMFVLVYSDDTFVPTDLSKLLVYLRDADMVVGTRTTRQMVEQGSNMRGLIRATHIVLAKLVEILWWRFECRFTDICCVYRAFWRSTYHTIRGNLSAHGVEIFPELLLEALRARKRIIEIPVNYYNRDAESEYVRSKYQSPATFWQIFGLIVRKRWQDSWGGRWWGRAAATKATPLISGEECPQEPAAEEAWYRTAERAWQNEVGYALLDKPYELPGSTAVFEKQWDRIATVLGELDRGVVVEVGCGKGHLLRRLHDTMDGRFTFVGLDLSRAVFSLPAHGLPGVMADGERLPLRSGSVAALVYDGALHHVIDYREGIREAVRVLSPGGVVILFEPVSSSFSRFVHRLLDPFIFRKTVYESPIDLRYKPAFSEAVVAETLRDSGLHLSSGRTDFLAYPFTGCYAGSAFARSERFMRLLMAFEERVARTRGLARLAMVFAWRFLIVARKAKA